MWNVRKTRPTLPEAEAADPAEDPRLVTLGDAGAFEKRDSKTDLKVELHQRLLDLINLSALDQMSREQIQAELLNLSNRDAYNIASLLRPKLIERPRWLGLLGINIALMLVLVR